MDEKETLLAIRSRTAIENLNNDTDLLAIKLPPESDSALVFDILYEYLVRIVDSDFGHHPIFGNEWV